MRHLQGPPRGASVSLTASDLLVGTVIAHQERTMHRLYFNTEITLVYCAVCRLLWTIEGNEIVVSQITFGL